VDVEAVTIPHCFPLPKDDVAQRKTLNEKQVAVLRWIADGCTSGVMEGDAHRVSAAAFRNRGLVTTSGRGRTWAAEITQAGREYLEQVDGPEPPVPRQANVSVTQQLVDDVIAAGGSLRVARKNYCEPGGIDYENRVRLAERYGKVPEDKRLTVRVVSRDELEIQLVEAPGHLVSRAQLVPLIVPKRVSRYHAAAREFRDRSERHEVSGALLSRATRIIHAIAVESERRGWSARASSESVNGYGRTDWTGTKNGHLQIAADQHDFWLRLQEEGVRTRGPWEEEVKRYRNVSTDWSFYRDRELPSGPYDAGATGRLKLELHADRSWLYSGRQIRWGDRQSWTLEERLPHLFWEVEERIAEADRVAERERIETERAAEAARRAAEARERKWQVLMTEARERLTESHRAAHLHAQVDAWSAAQRLRSYCDAVEASFGNNPNTVEWLKWSRAYILRLDPLTAPPVMPEPPEPSPDALQQHLPEGWSSHGPEYDHRQHHSHRHGRSS
jgi:hypothetical protein